MLRAGPFAVYADEDLLIPERIAPFRGAIDAHIGEIVFVRGRLAQIEPGFARELEAHRANAHAEPAGSAFLRRISVSRSFARSKTRSSTGPSPPILMAISATPTITLSS